MSIRGSRDINPGLRWNGMQVVADMFIPKGVVYSSTGARMALQYYSTIEQALQAFWEQGPASEMQFFLSYADYSAFTQELKGEAVAPVQQEIYDGNRKVRHAINAAVWALMRSPPSAPPPAPSPKASLIFDAQLDEALAAFAAETNELRLRSKFP